MRASTAAAIDGRDDTRTLASGAGFALVGRVGGRGIQVLNEIVLARVLGPAGFGLYSAGWTLLRISGLVAPLGLDRGVLLYGTRHTGGAAAERFKGVLLETIVAALAVGTVGGALLWFGAAALAGVFGKPELDRVFRGLAPAIPLYAGLRVAAAASRVSQRTIFSVTAEDVARPLANLVLIGAAGWLGWGLGGLVIAATASFAVALALALAFLVRLYPVLLDRTVVAQRTGAELFRFSATASVSSVAILLIAWIDRLMLSALRPASEVGLYQAATQPAFLFSTILLSFNAILVPMIADLAHRGAWGRLAELYRISTKWGLYVGTPLFLVLMFAPDAALRVVFGGQYIAAVVPMMVLAAGQLVNAGTGAVGPLLIMTGHARRWMLLSTVMLGVAIGLNLLLIPRWGMHGAAAATGISVAGLFLAGVGEVRRIHGFWPYDRRYGKGLVAAAFAALALALARHWLPHPGAPALAAALVLSTSIFGGVLLLLGLDDEDRELVRIVRERLSRSRGPA